MKELVEHIRTVHFTVLAVALILVMASGIEKKRPLQRAASDAEALLLVQQRWQEVESELKKAGDAAVSADPISYWDGTNWLTATPHMPGLYGSDVLIQGEVRRHLRFSTQKWLSVTTSVEFPPINSSLTRFSTLGQFLRGWDDFQTGNSAFAPLVLKTLPLPGYCAEAKAEGAGKADSWLTVDSQRSTGGTWKLTPRVSAYRGSPEITCNFQTVFVRPLHIELGAVFTKVTQQAYVWRKGSSTEAFGDLIAASKHLEETPLAQLVDILRDRADSDTERVELFQAKLPAETIPTYGSFILIICQLYLLAHLKELRRLTKGSHVSEWPTGYIGLYDGRLTWGLTIGALLFPAVAVFRVAWSFTSPELHSYRWAGLVASAILSAFSVWTLIVVRRSGPVGQAPPLQSSNQE